MNDPIPLGYISVTPAYVIEQAAEMIVDLQWQRLKLLEAWQAEWLRRKLAAWRRIWRWLGFRQPTPEHAKQALYASNGYITPEKRIGQHWKSQEADCRALIQLARATTSPLMWVSDQAVRRADMRPQAVLPGDPLIHG